MDVGESGGGLAEGSGRGGTRLYLCFFGGLGLCLVWRDEY